MNIGSISKTKIFILFSLIGLFIVLILDFMDSHFSFHDLLVEFHGLVFDLIIFGIILTTYEALKLKQENIERYKEEIDDYRFWFSEESKYRIKGLVNRLIKLNVKQINLNHCNISACPTIKKMIDWKFSGAKLYNCYFYKIDLHGSKFYHSEFHNSNFLHSNLKNCNFGFSILNDINFENCIFDNTDFLYAYIQDKEWFTNLEKKENKGVEELKSQYTISIDTVKIDSKEYYQVLNKNSKKRNAKTPNEIGLQMIEDMNSYVFTQFLKINQHST